MMQRKGFSSFLPLILIVASGIGGSCTAGKEDKSKHDSDSVRLAIMQADSLDSIRAAFLADSLARADSIARADSLREDSIRRIGENMGVIRKLYMEYVLVEQGGVDSYVKEHIAPEVMERMRRSHTENIGGSGYDFSIFRTGATDEPRGGSSVGEIQVLKKNWYHVSYIDRGYPGAAKVQIDTLGRIVDVR